uniref:Uncharacterized protein n=1 Tax=Heterorhabditis bacteriophora TaxID=37862 RepID=A0A1I7W6U5_HETBA
MVHIKWITVEFVLENRVNVIYFHANIHMFTNSNSIGILDFIS